MSSQIDPRLQYPPAPLPYLAQRPPLPRIQQPHDLPAIVSHSSLPHQPYYHLSPATASRLPTPQDSTSAAPPPPPSLPPTHLSPIDPIREQYIDHLHSDGQGFNGDPNDPKRSRACEACRGLKVRCDQDPAHPEQPCKRCAKAKRQCIITAPSRKRQKKTDSRVAELEKKIDALTASLRAKSQEEHRDGTANMSPTDSAYSTSGTPHGDASTTEGAGREWPEAAKRNSSGSNASSEHKTVRTPRLKRSYSEELPGDRSSDSSTAPGGRPGLRRADSNQALDIDNQIDKVIDRKLSSEIFDRYVADMANHLPAVVFSPGTSAAEVRTNKPILFLAILVAASVGITDMDVQQALCEVLMGAFADRIIRSGEKSLELIQSLMISTIWYRPPKRYEQMNFYQLTHIAAVMAIDVGMGKRSSPSKTWRMNPPEPVRGQKMLFNSDTLEARRTWLGCYFLCANTSMSLRRPNLIRWNGYMDECIEVLESSSTALPSDSLLCQHVRLQHINEEIGQQFSMDDPSAAITISDSRVQFQLKAFEHQLGEWSKGVPKAMRNNALQFSEHVSGLYMHEIAMHINHNVDDFRAPFTEESLKATSGQSFVLTSAHSSALSECLTSVHGMFRHFFAFDLTMVRALPIFYFVRIAYAVVVLIKLYFAVTAPGSEVGKIISKQDLEVEQHLDRLLRLFHTIADDNAFRPATRFLLILGRLRQWFQQNKDVKNGSGQASKFNSRAIAAAADESNNAAKARSSTEKARHGSKSHPKTAQPPPPPPQQPPHPQHHHHPNIHHKLAQTAHQYPAQPPTPLHFLSEVATNNPSASGLATPSSMPPHHQQQQHPQQHQHAQQQPHQPHQQPPPSHAHPQFQQQMQQQQWYPGMPMAAGPMDLGYGGANNGPGGVPSNAMDANLEYGMGSGFEQAMDMTLGTADADLSSLFLGDPMFAFGLGGPADVGGEGMFYSGY